jgi:dipeptidyl aminopeptidase/acylaminoacyl peptidase
MPLNLEELVSLPSVSLVTPSWSGDQIAYYADQTGRTELYVMDLHSRKVRQVSGGQVPRRVMAGFSWRRDDTRIVFTRDHDGNEMHNLFQIDLATGAVVQLNDSTTQEYVGEAHPDNQQIVVMSNREGGQQNIYLLNLELETHEWKALTRFNAPTSAGRWSPDGRWLAFSSNETTDFKNRDAYLVSADGAEVRKVLSVKPGSQDGIADWHPTDPLVAVTTDAFAANRAGIMNLKTNHVRWLGPDTDQVSEYAGRFSPDGEWLVVIRNQDATIMPVLYRVSDGAERQLKLPPGLATGVSFVLGQKLLLTHTSATRRPEVLLYDLETDAFEVLLAAKYGSINPDVFVPDSYLRYPSFDGQDVPAILYAPRDREPGKRYPALVDVHGGPTAQFLRSFDPFVQFLVDRGYVILQPNIRGSTGYGTRWRDANIRDWGGGDLEDVAAGAAYLQSLEFVDPERIGIYGGSFGGFMSYLASVKKPHVWKVSVPIVGITDLHKLYEVNARIMPQLGYYFRSQMGDPDSDFDLWRDRSAVTHAANLRAKMLIVHGSNDPRCPIEQAHLFRDRLLALGRTMGTHPDNDFEYAEFTDEGHGAAGDIQGKLRQYRLLEDFLARRL